MDIDEGTVVNSSDNSNAAINQCYCHYQDDFIASFEHENIAGTQFHPELSQTNGLKLLKNFIDKFQC